MKLVAPALLLLLATPAVARAELTVANHEEGDHVTYPVLLLRGRSSARVVVKNASNDRPDGRNAATPRDGRYKVLVELRPGTNALELSNGAESSRLTIIYDLPRTEHRVNAIYLTAEDGDGRYLTQRKDDPQDFEAKLDTALKLMQTFTAESLNDAGCGRRTFALELSEEGRVVVHRLAYPAPRETLHEKDGNALYALFEPWVAARFPTEKRKNVVVMGFTGYDPVAKKPLGHTALGGGGMGLFSSNGMCAWPSSIREVARAFADPTPVDTGVLWDDSAGRSQLWGLAATTMGATLHELGHTFGLPHSEDPESIMSRGFDHLNRFFTVEEPRRGAGPVAFEEGQVARWDPPFAARLAASPWFDPAGKREAAPPPSVALDVARDEVAIRADAGLRAIEVVRAGAKVMTRAYPDRPRGITFARATLCELSGAPSTEEALSLVVTDALGRQVMATVRRPTGRLDQDGHAGFAFGATVAEVAARVGFPGATWETLPVAGEFKTAEVRYLWRPFRELPQLPVPGDRPVAKSAYACFLFREGRLFRISLRFANDADVKDHRFVLDAFLREHPGLHVVTGEDVRAVLLGSRVAVLARTDAGGTVIDVQRRGEVHAEGERW